LKQIADQLRHQINQIEAVLPPARASRIDSKIRARLTFGNGATRVKRPQRAGRQPPGRHQLDAIKTGSAEMRRNASQMPPARENEQTSRQRLAAAFAF